MSGSPSHKNADPLTHGRLDSLGDPRTLHEVLADLGLTTRPARLMAQKDVLDSTGAVLCTGTAGDVWAWLRETGRVA